MDTGCGEAEGHMDPELVSKEEHREGLPEGEGKGRQGNRGGEGTATVSSVRSAPSRNELSSQSSGISKHGDSL